MSTRDDVLAALTDSPNGLTAKEIAPLCPSAEFDEQIVGSNIATLRGEGIIHTVGVRGGAAVYVFGAGPSKQVNEPALAQPVISKHAQAIAAMRAPKEAAERAPDRAPTPATTPSPSRPAASLEAPMKITKPLTDRAFDAIKAHGPLTLAQIADRTGSTVGSLYTILPKLRSLGVVKDQPNQRQAATYAVGKLAPGRDVLAAGAELCRKLPQPKEKKKAPPQRINGRAPIAAPSPGGAFFAINENGELGIEKEDSKLKLCRAEIERLRAFIQLCEPILEGVEAA